MKASTRDIGDGEIDDVISQLPADAQPEKYVGINDFNKRRCTLIYKDEGTRDAAII